jgi:hypothetical protein
MVSRDFILAGKAIFTIEPSAAFVAANPTAKAHYTFRVVHKEAEGGYPEAYFVSMLTGADNENDYTYVAKLDPAYGHVNLTRGSHVTAASHPYRILARVIARIWADEGDVIEAAGWKVYHVGRCGRCGRTLTVPESIESGIGPECARVMAAACRCHCPPSRV